MDLVGRGSVWQQSPLRQTLHAPPPQRSKKVHFDPRETILVRSLLANIDPRVGAGEPDEESSAEDVIDLGAPRLPKQRRPPAAAPPRRVLTTYTPNPRLYPGFTQKKRRPRAEERAPRRRHKRVLRRAVPNARLYRPAPPRARAPPPPPAAPRVSWPAPAPPAPRALDTASRAALRLAERRAQLPPPPPPPQRSPHPRRLRTHRSPATSRVPSLRRFYDIAAAEGRRSASPTEPPRCRRAPAPASAPAPAPAPASALPARRLLVTLPEGAMTSSASDELTDTPDAASAPSEYLAEFLSAIMRQQYAEALAYCRLILRYEPHNATARGFHPLLQQKLRLQRDRSGASVATVTAVVEKEEVMAGGAIPDLDADPEPYSPQEMDQEEDESQSQSASLYSLGSASDGDGDDSDRSLSLSRSDRTDRTDCTDPLRSSSGSPATSAESAASADLNGNCAAPQHCADDVKNDNARDDHIYFNLNNESSASLTSLQRLRARFACSK